MMRWRCKSCHRVCVKSALLRAPNPFHTDGEDVEGCPVCYSVGDFDHLCDEPDCDMPSCCGTPTNGGYRWTCHYHTPEAR